MSLLAAATGALKPALAASALRRTLVSSVLLTKQWENHTVNDLRKEARKRNLAPNGSKATLITRIQAHEQQTALAAHAPSPTPPSRQQQVRHAVTLNSPPTTAAAAEPAPGADAPGIPPAVAAEHVPPQRAHMTLDIKLPDLSVLPPEAPVQIPYGPDFWRSIPAKSTQPLTPQPPQLLVVAGSATHPAGGPSTSSHTVLEPTPVAEAPAASDARSTIDQGFWVALAEDVGVPTSLKRASEGAGEGALEKLSFEGLPERMESSGADAGGSGRALDEGERRGAWVLGGLLAGAWLAGGLFKKASTVDVKKAVDEVKGKAEEAKGKVEEKAGEVKDKYEEVKGKASAKADDVKGKAEEKAGEAKGKYEEVKGKAVAKVDDAKAKTKEVYEAAKGKASEKVEEAKSLVKSK